MGIIRLILADDHQVLLDSLANYFSNHDGFKVNGLARTGNQVLEILAEQSTDLLISDLNMPGNYKLEMLRQVRREYPEVRILVLSMYGGNHGGRGLIRQLRTIGVQGYVHKAFQLDDLVRAIDPIMAGRVVYKQPPVSADSKRVEDDFMRQFKLTAREMEVLILVARDHSSKEISMELGVSIATVATHRKNLMRKLNLHSASALTKFAISNGLV